MRVCGVHYKLEEISIKLLGRSGADREALLELAGAMPSQERQPYPAITAPAQVLAEGEVVEVEAPPVEPGEPTGEEQPLDE